MVWTDAFQTIIMYGGVIIIAIAGTRKVGGIGKVWDRNYQSGRVEFFK